MPCKHEFEQRYNYEQLNKDVAYEVLQEISFRNELEAIKAIVPKTYVCDVCIKCGFSTVINK